MRNFISKIQNSSPAAKLRWVVIFSAVAMLGVVGIWLGYEKLTGSDSGGSSLFISKTESTQPGFFKTLGLGVESIVNSLQRRTANVILYFGHKIGKENSFTITASPVAPSPTQNNKINNAPPELE